MSRKNLAQDDDDLTQLGSNPRDTLDKMPTNISDGSKPLPNCFLIPVTQLKPFEKKDGRDFSRLAPELAPEFNDTILNDGIIELLIVRPLENPTGKERYEILAGETRWRSAMAVGMKEVPCRVMKVDDAKAHKIFSLTNLFRRNMKPSDKVLGYYHYYKYMIDNGQIKELQDGIRKKDVETAGGNVEELSYRQLMYYVAMTNLTPEWLKRFDQDTVSIKAGSVIASFPKEIQDLLLPYTVTEKDARFLKDVYNGKNKDIPWSEELIEHTLKPLVKEPGQKKDGPKPTDDQVLDPVKVQEEKHFRKMRKHIIEAVHTSLRPADYDNARSVISEALRLYYQKIDEKKG